MKKYKNEIIFVMLFSIMLALDIVSKFLLDNKFITLIKGVLSFYSTHNTGAGFSIFSNQTLFLIIITIVFLVLFTLYNVLDKSKKSTLWWVSVAIIYAGAIGNMIDRFAYNYVRDFICLDFINFPIFNVADICLTVGVVLFAINFIIINTKKDKKNGI